MPGLLVANGTRIQTVEEYNGTTSYTRFASTVPWNPATTATGMALVYPRSAGESNIGYIFGCSNGTASEGLRMNMGVNEWIGAGDSSSSSGTPSLSADSGLAYNVWRYFAVTWNGGLTASSALANYSGTLTSPIKAAAAGTSSTTNGSGSAVGYAVGADLMIGNRDSEDRTFDGFIALVARWNRVLTLGELRRAQRFGPLSVPKGLAFCWANGRDYGPYHMRPSSSLAVVREKAPF